MFVLTCLLILLLDVVNGSGHAFAYGSYGVYYGGYAVSDNAIALTGISAYRKLMTDNCDAKQLNRAFDSTKGLLNRATLSGSIADYICFLSKGMQILVMGCGEDEELIKLQDTLISALTNPKRPAPFKALMTVERFQYILDAMYQVKWTNWQVPDGLKAAHALEEALLERSILLIANYLSVREPAMDFVNLILQDYRYRFVEPQMNRQVHIRLAPDASLLLANLALNACTLKKTKWIYQFQQFMDTMVRKNRADLAVSVAFELSSLGKGAQCVKQIYDGLDLRLNKQLAFPSFITPSDKFYFRHSPMMRFKNLNVVASSNEVTVFLSTGDEDETKMEKFKMRILKTMKNSVLKSYARDSRFIVSRIRSIIIHDTILESDEDDLVEKEIGSQLSIHSQACNDGPCGMQVIRGDILIAQERASSLALSIAEKQVIKRAWTENGREALLQIAASYPITSFYHMVLIE